MTTAAYFVIPDGSFFSQVSMGGHPLVYRQPATHPDIRKIERLNPDVTHVEFRKVLPELYAVTNPRANYGLPIYIFVRALRADGPLIDGRWEEIPLQR